MKKTFLIVVFTLNVLTVSAWATTRYVPSQYSTIQSAINACSHGDTVLVADGIYRGAGNRDIDFHGKAITVQSENGPEFTIVDCQGGPGNEHRGFYFHNNETANSILDGFTIKNGYVTDDSGAGILCERSSPKVTNCILRNNTAYDASTGVQAHGGGICNLRGSPRIISCDFIGNSGGWGGGAANHLSDASYENCIFQENVTQHLGGGALNVYGNISFTNCVFVRNRTLKHYSKLGRACWSTRCSTTFVNCTINQHYRDAIHLRSDVHGQSHATIKNCIIWNNWTSISLKQEDGVPVVLTVNYSDVEGGHSGEGNIDENPLFAPDEYRLLRQSPCINAGDPAFVSQPDDTDIDGRPRIVGGRVDMGAYEFNHTPIADAGPDQTVYAWFDGIAKVILDGSGSYDDDGDVLSFLWSWIVDGNSFTALGLRPIVELPVGEHIIELTVNDGIDDSEPDEVVIVVLPAMATAVKLTPRVLNLDSQGHWLKAHFVLPVGFSVEDVNANTPATVEPFGIESEYMSVSVNEDGRVEIKAAFDRATFCDTGMDYGPAEVAVVGLLTSGQYFYGIDTIKIITNQLKFLGVLASYWLQTSCDKPDWCGGFDLDQDGVVNFRDYALFDGCCIEVP